MIVIVVVSVSIVAVVSDGADVFSIPWCDQCGVIVSETVVVFLMLLLLLLLLYAFGWCEPESSPFRRS